LIRPSETVWEKVPSGFATSVEYSVRAATSSVAVAGKVRAAGSTRALTPPAAA